MTTYWNFTLEDTSPVLQYSPYSDGVGLTNGWQVYFPDIGFVNQTGEGSQDENSLHLTSLNNASVTLSFDGTAVYLYGTANCSFDVTLDNVVHSAQTPSGNLLYSSTDMTAGTHFVSLTARPSNRTQQLGFDYAVVSMPVDSSKNPPSPVVYENTNSSLIYEGSWTVTTDSQIPNSTVPIPYHTTNSKGTVSMTFAGGDAVAIYGPSNYGNWQYSIMLDGTPTTLNSSGFWLIPNAVLFFQAGLDPKATHTINMTNIAGDGMIMSINSIAVFESNTGTTASSHKKSNAGVIAGTVVAVVVAIVALLGVFFWWKRRHSRGFFATEKPQHTNVLDEGPSASTFNLPHSHEHSLGYTSATSPPGVTSTPYTGYKSPSHTGYESINPSASGWSQLPPNLSSEKARLQRSDPSMGASRSAHSPNTSYDATGELNIHSAVGRPLPGVPTAQQPITSAGSVDVDQIVEMIAARIDRPGVSGHGMSPPQYQG